MTKPTLDSHLAAEVKGLVGKQVNVMKGKKVLHKGEVLGNTVSGIMVGLTWTSLGVSLKPGQKFISIFYTSRKNLVVEK